MLDNNVNGEALIHLKSRIRDIGLSSFSLYNKKDHRFHHITFNSKHKVNKEVRHLLDMESTIKACLDDLSEEDRKFLNRTGSRLGVMYGMCKVHKEVGNQGETPPFRPILSAIGTCTYNMAKFFVPILKTSTVNQFTIDDYFSFADEIVKQDSE